MGNVSSLRSRGDGQDRERGAKGDKDGARDGRNARGLAAVDLRPVPELLGAVPAPAAHAAACRNGARVGHAQGDLGDKVRRGERDEVVRRKRSGGETRGGRVVATQHRTLAKTHHTSQRKQS